MNHLTLLGYLLFSGFATIASALLRGPDGSVCTRQESRTVMYTVENRRKREPSSGVLDYLRMWNVFGIKKARTPRSFVTVYYAIEYFTVYECCAGWNRINDTCQGDCHFPCEHGWCVQTNDCECDEGWEGGQCEHDIDECWYGIDECDHVNGGCTNTEGSYECYCDDGLHFINGTVCQELPDVDECARGDSGCAQNCHNTHGSYFCTCDAGYVLAADDHNCTEARSCSFVRCPNTSIQISLPKDNNYILVDFSDYVKSVDAQLSEMTPIVDNIMSPNVTYPIMKYEVSPSKTLEAGQYLYHVTRFIACNDTCDVSVLIKDNTEPHILNCPELSQNLQGEECRDVNLYDYYSKSRIASCFGDNVGIKDVICRQTHLDRIAIGETAHITCYATDIAGTSSASYNITFHCKKNVCPPLKPPTHGAFVCHVDNLVQRCVLLCKEGKFHKRRNIFECDMTNPSSTWTGAGVDDIICQNRGRLKQRFTFNMSCDSDDLDFHRDVKRTLSGTRNGHQLCLGMSDDDCEINHEEDRESNCTRTENGMIVGETNGAVTTTLVPTILSTKMSTQSTVDKSTRFDTALETTKALSKTTTITTSETSPNVVTTPSLQVIITESPSSALTPISTKLHTSPRQTTQPPAQHYNGNAQSPSSSTTNPGVDRPHESTLPVVPFVSAAAGVTVTVVVIAVIIHLKKKNKLAIAAAYSDQDGSCHSNHETTVPCDDSLERLEANKVHENNLLTTINALRR